MKLRASGTLLALAVAAALLQDPGALEVPLDPAIEELRARRDGEVLSVSFRVTSAFDEELLDRLQSGIPVRFKHRVRVMAKRGLPLMPAKELGRTRIETEATYDALTGQYSLVLESDFRSRKDEPPRLEDARTTSSEDEVRRFMTEFTDVPVYDPDPEAEEPLSGERLRVRVESNLGRRFYLLIFPGTRNASAELFLEP